MTGGLMSIAHAARPVRIGVVGDLILDRYLRGETERISPEAPIPVLTVGQEEVRLGGAGNVVANLLSVGADVWVGGVVGQDDNGDRLARILEGAGADLAAVTRDASRPTVEKVRLIARSQQVLRFDREDVRSVEGAVEAQLAEAATRAALESDLVVVSDYAKGTVTTAVLSALVASGRPVLVDPKGTDYSRYRGVFGITPNRAEAEAATHIPIHDEASLAASAAALFEIVDSRVVLITLGADGIYCAERDGDSFQVKSEARKVFDVTGAGDTVIALLARYLAADVPLRDAVRIANAGAGVVVGRLGAVSITMTELYRALQGEQDEFARKIMDRDEASELARDLRAEGLRVVFTNGCFDLLHAGHVRYLALARAQGDVLVVGVNDDASVRQLKGPSRPLMALEDRAALLAALEAVDFVVPFGEQTPGRLIEELTPDVLVKGEDWRDKGVVGADWVEQHGGRVFLAPLLDGRSTSGLVERIQRSEGFQGGDEPTA